MRFIPGFILLILVFGACKKYPEDEAFIHFKRPERRLEKSGNYKITEYTINGVDSIPHVNSKLYNGFKLEELSFNGSSTRFHLNAGGDIYLKFINNKKEVEVRTIIASYGLTYPLFGTTINNAKILRLDKTVMRLEVNRNSKTYIITFTKIS